MSNLLDKTNKSSYIPYNKALTEKARENRKNPTSAEKKLWYEILGNKRLDNLKFTRQNRWTNTLSISIALN